MTSDSDDLEAALRENLKLRHELATNVAKAEAAGQRGGMAYRLGWVLYWTCLALAAGCAAFVTWLLIVEREADLLSSLALGIGILVLYGLGRAFRYVLSGE